MAPLPVSLSAVLAAVLTIGSLVDAQLAPRISVSHGCTGFDQACAIDLVEGLDQWVSLSLDEPIICHSQDIECSVIVNISNSHPNIVAVEPCYVRWERDQWHHTKRVRVTARQSYTHSGPQQIHLETNVVTQASYYLQFDPLDLFIVAEERRTATCYSVGDPHYGTFDGKYWHFYDGRSRNPTRITLYRSTTRDFVVQNQVRGYPAGNCGIAAREGRDRVVVDNCGGRLQIITDYHSEVAEQQPRIQVSGSQYTVYFHSGAYVKMSVSGWMNLYVGGVDYQASCGICGNFNGNANDDAPADIVRSYTDLFPCQQVPSVVPGARTYSDMWNWQYNAADFGVEDTSNVPDSQADCPYELQRIVRPIINTEDVEDITDALRDRTDAIRDQNGDTFTFDPATGDATVVQTYDINLATTDCTNLINGSQTVAVCRQRYADFESSIPDFIDDCAFDYSEMGGPNSAVATEFFEGFIRVMEQQCLELTIENGDAGVADLQAVLCDNACSGQGTCGTGASCTCNSGFAGEDCSIDLNSPPEVRIISDLAYDVSGTQQGMSPREIQLTGSNFLLSGNLVCRFGNSSTSEMYITNGTYIGPLSIICPVPIFRYSGAVGLNLPLTVSNDGNIWSEATFHFLFYDGVCQRCNERGECGINNETCTVGTGATAQCYLAGHTATGDDANPCQTCQPSVSNTRLAYTYAPRQCRPVFTNRIYQTEILGSAAANEVILTVDAMANSLVTGDPDGYTIQYTYIPGADRDTNVQQWFDVNQNGDVYILRPVDISSEEFMNMEHAAQDPTRFSGHFSIQATDRFNYTIQTDVIIQLVPEGYRPIFPLNGFRANIAENPINGDPVFNSTGTVPLVIQANDPDPDADLSSVEYTWHLEPADAAGALLIDRTTGAVTVGNGSKVDFETTPVLHYQVRASDNALLFFVTDVYVNVTDVAEPPSAVLINGSTEIRIPENSAGEVGNLSSVDPEGGVFTYSLGANQYFTLMQHGDGVYFINLTTQLDFESLGSSPQFDLQVTTTDSTGQSYTGTVTILITDVNEHPLPAQVTAVSSLVTLNGNDLTLSEGIPLATPLVSVVAVDPEGGDVTCYVANTYFVIANNMLQARAALDFETNPEFSLTVLCEDPEGNQGVDTTITVHVTNVNEAPWVSAWTNQQSSPVPENQAPGTQVIVGQVTITDDGNSATPVVTATNSTLFEVGPLNCGATDSTTPLQCTAEVFLKSTAVVSYEDAVNGLYPIFLTLADNANQAGGVLSVVVGPPTTTVSLRVADVAEGPTGITVSTNAIVENPPTGTVVAVLTIDDEDSDSDFSVAITSNPGGDAFEVVANSTADARRQTEGGKVWNLVVVNGASIDYETSQSITVGFSVTDNNIPATIQVDKTFSVTDAPMSIETNTLSLTGQIGPSGVVFSLTNLDNEASRNSLTWSISPSNWATVVKQADGSGSLQVTDAQTYTANGNGNANLRTLIVTASFATGTPIVGQVVLNILEVQDVPVFTESSYSSVVQYFSGAPQDVSLTSVAATGSDSNRDEAMEFFVVRVVEGTCPSGQVCMTVYHSAVGNTENRYIFSDDFAQTNDMSALSSVTLIKETGMFSSCPNIEKTGISFSCPLEVESAPAVTPAVLSAGSLADPASPSMGYFVVAKLRSVNGRDATVDMELGALSPLTVTFLGENNMPPAPDGATSTWQEGDDYFAETPSGTVQWTGETWEPHIVFVGASTSENDSSAMASWIWVVIVLVLVVLVLGVAVGFFYYQKTHNAADLFDGREKYADSVNPAWLGGEDPVPYEVTPFVPGVRSAMYDWYYPKMTRKECTEHLIKRGEGAFVVRDSDANPGWFMLGVKSDNQVVHDKIRQTENGEYQLMPSSGQAANVAQPCFDTLPDLIDFYLTEQAGMPYALTASDPVYDNQRLHQERTGAVEKAYDEGPSVPQKEREYAEADYSFGAGASTEKHGGDSVGNPMYFASPNVGSATYAGTEGYLDVVSDDQTGANAGYLDVSNPTGNQSRGYLDVEPDAGQSSTNGYSDVPFSA